jgi:hypothetical protein
MPNTWINAVIEITVPLNVDPRADAGTKLGMAERVWEKLIDALPEDFPEHASVIRWEEATE